MLDTHSKCAYFMMKSDGCSRKAAATINDINNNINRGSVIKIINNNNEC